MTNEIGKSTMEMEKASVLVAVLYHCTFLEPACTSFDATWLLLSDCLIASNSQTARPCVNIKYMSVRSVLDPEVTTFTTKC